MGQNETIDADVSGYRIARTTDAAFGFAPADDDAGDVEFWLPKSQCGAFCYSDGSRVYRPLDGKSLVSVEIPVWLADERGLSE